MPLYEYACEACKKVFTDIRSVTQRNGAPCPQCGKRAPKLLSAPNFQCKGPGTYKYETGQETWADVKWKK